MTGFLRKVAAEGIESLSHLPADVAARLYAEAVRCTDVVDDATLPDDVGPVPPAPARGAMVVKTSRVMEPDGDRGYIAKDGGYRGRRVAQRMDVFDRMVMQAERHKLPVPLGVLQIEVARNYRSLIERYSALGVRCSSIEGQSGGGGDATAWLDHALQDRKQVQRIRGILSDPDHAMVMQPKRKGKRGAIRSIDLVDRMCLQDQSLSEVLRAFGWSATQKHRVVLLDALRFQLDRMAWPVSGRMVSMRPDDVPNIFE